MTERDLLVDCLRRLNGCGASYMLTGSMVSNYWGIPRSTHDLDFVIQLPEAVIPRLIEAFAQDFYMDSAAIRAAFRPPYQFNAIDTRTPLKVDFWLLQPKPFDMTMFDRRLRVELFDEPAWICTAEDVVLHKLYWNSITPSERQLGDAAGVAAVQGDTLDIAYMQRWAKELHVVETLDALLTGKLAPKST